MEKLNFQDLAFLRMESQQRPFHVAGLLVFSPPASARPDYLRRLARDIGAGLPRIDALFRRRLEAVASSAPYWVEADDYDPAYHVHHYALPQPGRMEDLLALLSRTHERLLDRSRPLWEWHLVEGLPRKRFGLYCKVHHSLMDGVGAMRMIDKVLSENPRTPFGSGHAGAAHKAHAGNPSPGWFAGIAQAAASLRDQGKAIPQLASMLMRMGNDGHTDSPPLPFTAPRATMNYEISHRRRLLTAQFPLAAMRRIGASVDGTVNDALLAICGGGLRSYLLEQRKLPKQALLAGVPVSVRTPGEQHGNELSMIVCPLGTTSRDPQARLRHISRATRKAKQHLRELSPTARQDYMNMVLLPAVLLTVAGASTSVPPPFNVLVSNVPGPAGRLYMAGSRLEEIYPLSLVTDAQALNITAVSCGTKLCLGITACPDNLPQIEHLGAHLDAAYRELKSAVAS
jgi:WS/DGAT/MGAT family acyltransferase